MLSWLHRPQTTTAGLLSLLGPSLLVILFGKRATSNKGQLTTKAKAQSSQKPKAARLLLALLESTRVQSRQTTNFITSYAAFCFEL
jgi:hypothetical protein